MTGHDLMTSDTLIDTSLGLIEHGMRDLAVIAQLAAIRHAPDNARAHVALAESLLTRDEYPPGFREHEYRTQLDPGYRAWPHLDSAQWCGMRLPHTGRLLVVGDQGFGDTLMFSRYLPWASQHTHHLDLGVDPAIAPLFQGLPGVHAVFSEWKDAPGHAAHVRLSSLPMLHNTTINTIPRPIGLNIPPMPEVWWPLFSEATKGKPRIGVVWRGREETKEQRARSIPFTPLAMLMAKFREKATFLILQRDMRHDEGLVPVPTAHLEALKDWSDTAAVVSHLDLLITSDTAMAHLAGTIGVPCWILLKHVADWRWGLDRTASPWYPMAQLFRQPGHGRWDPVLRDLAAALTEFCA